MFSTYQPLAVYPADGVQTDFDAPDMFYDVEDLNCVIVANGEEITQIQGVDYSVVVLGRENIPPYRQQGFLRFIVPPPAGADVVPFILPAMNQDQSFQGRAVTPKEHERVHDRAIQSVAMLYEFFNRGYRSPLNTPSALRFVVAGREGYVPTWDAAGNLIEGPTVGQVATVAQFIGNVNIVAGIQSAVVALAALEPEIVALYNVRTALADLGGRGASITALAPFTAELTALAPVATQIGALGPIAANITTVAGVAAGVTTLAGISAQITALYNIRAAITAVDGIKTSVSAVAAIDDEIVILSAIAANITTLAPQAANIGTLAPQAANIAALGPKAADITTAAANIAAIIAAPTHATNAANSALEAANYAAMVNFWKGTQAQYDAIPAKDPNRLYFITA